jgi:hypothetical protein
VAYPLNKGDVQVDGAFLAVVVVAQTYLVRMRRVN